MPIVALLLAMTLDEAAVAAAMARAQALTRADAACRTAASEDEILVCGGRRADRFRVPLVTARDPGDPRTVDALGERERLLAVPQPACGTGAFLQRCGFVGFTASTRSGAALIGERPLAK